jgi:hypothetical protein
LILAGFSEGIRFPCNLQIAALSTLATGPAIEWGRHPGGFEPPFFLGRWMHAP